MNRDQIILEAISVETQIGCLDEEQKGKQPLLIDLILHGNFSKACQEDLLEGTVDYCLVIQSLRHFSEQFNGKTIEHFAHTLALELKEEFSLLQVDVCVSKPRYTKALGLEGIKVRVSR